MKHFLGSIFSVITFLAFAAHGSAMEKEKVTYLFPAPHFVTAFAPFQLAKFKGYFDQENLDVTFRVGKGGADVATQVAAGNADLGGGIGDTAIIVRPNGVPIRGVALLGGRGLTQIVWRKDSGIKSVADLKGKAIGVLSYGATPYYNLLAVLAAQGLRKGDVSIQALGEAGIIQMIGVGKLQAFSGPPEWAVATEVLGVEIQQVPADTIFPAMAQAIIAADSTIEKRPEMIRKFVRAVLRGVHDIVGDPVKAGKELVSFMPQYAGKEGEVEAIMKAYAMLVYPEYKGQPLGTFDRARLEETQKFYLQNGIIQKAVAIEDVYTNAFVR